MGVSPASSAVRIARWAGLLNTARIWRPASAGASDLAAASPSGVSGMSVRAGVPPGLAPLRLAVPEQDQFSHRPIFADPAAERAPAA